MDPGGKVGNLRFWGVQRRWSKRKDGHKTVPPLFSHTLRSRAPRALAGPSPGNLVKVLNYCITGHSRVNDGEWTGPVYLTNWEVA